MKKILIPVVLAAALAGCGMMGGDKPQTITFEAAGFMKVYMAERDNVIRQTAPAVKKCLTVTDTSPIEQRRKCDELKALLAEWERRDAVVYTALITGNTVETIDWEKAADIAGKLIGAAAGIAL